MQVRTICGTILAAAVALAAAEAEGGARVELPLDGGWSGSVSGDDGTVRSDGDITLPHNWDDYYGHRQMFHGDLHGTATYHRVVHVARRPGERQFLVFDGAGTFLTVRLNGKELCRRRHAGRLVTTLEATDAVRDGDNALEVLCEHPRDIENTPWQCGGCGYCTCESPEAFGLFRRVRLVTTGRARVAPFGLHVWHDGECRTAFVEAEVDTGGTAAEDLKVRFVSKELGVDKVLPCAKTVRGEFALGDVERWSPKHPKMYEVMAEILDRDGRIIDAETVRTGFASVRWPLARAGDNRFFLNGEPVFVHGTAETDHRLGERIAFDDEEVDARVGEVKRLGFNMFREGHEPHDLRYLSQMEERGLMCWAGFSTRNYADTEEFRRTFLECVGQWVKERRNSPAVVIWGLQNESALPHEFARECTELVRKLDPLSGPKGRPVVTCNGGDGTDWNVVQNWSGTYEGYGGTLMTYEQDLAKPSQLLNGEYGAWRVAGWHSDPDEPFDLKGAWTEEHQARVLYEKLMRGWKARDKVCGHLLWTFFSHCNPGRDSRVEEGYREIDKIGPVNMKGLYTLDGRRVEAWYLYLAFGRHFEKGDLAEHVDRPLSWWLAEGRRLAAAPAAAECRPSPLPGKTYIHRLNCGGDAVTDSCGNRWTADDSRYVRSWSQDGDMQIKGYELNPVLGSQGVVDGGVSNAAKEDQELFGTFRYGRSRQSFALSAPANATCEVEVYFVEPGSYGRMFDVAINGKVVDGRLRLGDMVPERNVVRRRYEVDTGTNSEIRITFPRVQVNQATVAAIAVSTDAQSAARMPPELRKPGYPESDGLTWKELSARVRHSTPARLLPLGGRAAAMKAPLRALPFPDKGGFHRVLFHPYAAGSYSIRFRVVAGNPVGKRVKWKIEAESWVDDGVDRTIKTGEAILAGPVTEDGFIDMPMDVFVNAGGYFVSYMIEDDSLSAREFRQ